MIEAIKTKSGVSYRARIYGVDGKPRSKSFPTRTLAKEWERRVLRDRDEQEATGIIVTDGMGFKEFSEKWFREKVMVRLANSTQVNYRRCLNKHLLPPLGLMRLRDIRVEHANQLIVKLKETNHSPKGINTILGVLLTILNDAVEWQCLARNPLHKYRPVKEPEAHYDYWTAPEIQQFLNGTRFDRLGPVFVVALNTGMRRGELCALKWDRIDFVRNQIIVSRNLTRFGLSETTKSGKKRYVPINPIVKEVLQKLLRAQRSDFVFCEEDGTQLDAHHLYRDFHKAQARAGFEKLIRFHDLRHTFASHFMMNGGNIYDLQKILGHYSLEMTQRYAHMSPDHLAEAIQIVSFKPEEASGESLERESGKVFALK
ncbi:MAG: tyrosine-type recombinase/integrase [Bdellovibrionota bacterium]